MNKLLLITFLLFMLSCKGQDCETLPLTYTSYSEAVKKISSATFNFTDSVNTSSSSWIRNANFYSCNGRHGYLILKTAKKNYIFKNVPKQVWYNFKEASSFGEFYNKNIRGRYKLI
ncbi:KTSC domain-containing protein [Polaribacter sp. R2A056_3_33]|uniref:KTSC domain-containing protein n=1 Tax=Polaribacter sp. R2A056_3_33 TaxID=2745563 RepID=UPI001C4EA4E3|nr:KTSC domain-containing protein [Polaribacter sp. R2A056_3_33]QXP69372.1 KTSC domain-containing protein [Polaribacter sp. R2A056_3_33]